MNKRFTLELIGDLDFEGMVIDICFDNQPIATVNYDKGIDCIEIEIFAASEELVKKSFLFDDFINILESSKKLAIKCAKEDEIKKKSDMDETKQAPRKPKSFEKFSIILASPPDRERLVAEIWCDNMFWAEISHENEEAPLAIQFYPHPKEKYWEFPLDQALEVLERAKKNLLGMGVIPE